MGKELERDLGLPSVTAISIGAMVGSGIFILPGLAMKMAGPAVEDADLLVVSGIQRHLTDRLFGHLSELPTAETEHGTLVVYGASKPGRLRRAIERRLF